MTRLPILLLIALAFALGIAALTGGVAAQREAGYTDSEETRDAMARALSEAKAAEGRGERLEKEAREATEAAERTSREAAALAARIQQAEAGIEAAEARITLIDGQRKSLAKRLSDRREPLVRLTAALQKLARRPLVLSALRPGSLRETVYMRALLESTIPQVRQRTAALRAEVERGQRLEMDARQALANLSGNEADLEQRRKRLAAIETRQRLAARQASGVAARETDRALALAEEARDLEGLMEQFDRAGSLREELAALPGPIMRPPRPGSSQVIERASTRAASPARTASFQLPVTGRTISGFGEQGAGGTRNTGLTLAPREGAQVVAPAAGRVAFAGPYRGYGAIVIVEHAGGWTSLITGLARTDVSVGEELLAGAPIGVAEVERPLVMLELRKDGTPVNPLEHLR